MPPVPLTYLTSQSLRARVGGVDPRPSPGYVPSLRAVEDAVATWLPVGRGDAKNKNRPRRLEKHNMSQTDTGSFSTSPPLSTGVSVSQRLALGLVLEDRPLPYTPVRDELEDPA